MIEPASPERASEAGRTAPDVRQRIAEAARLRSGGEARKALAWLEEAPADGRGRMDWLLEHARCMRQLARLDDALADAQAAVAVEPTAHEALALLAGLQRSLGRLAEAESSWRRLLDTAPRHADATVNLALVLRDAGRPAEAVPLLEPLLTDRPDDGFLLMALGTSQLAMGNPAAALASLRRSLSINPYDRATLAYYASALVEAGALEEARRLLAPRVLLKSTRLPTPAGWSDFAAFAADLVEAIRGDAGLAYERGDNTTRGGYQTGNLLEGTPAPAVSALEQLFHQATASYLAALPRAADHPYFAWRPERWRIQCWGVILASQGHQEPHIHRDGWVSGVCYLSVPASVASGAGPDGWLEFGRPPAWLDIRQPPLTFGLRPQSGLLALFPSWYFHRTIPFADGEERICIAFDVLPEV